MNTLEKLGKWVFAVVGGIGLGAAAVALSQPGDVAFDDVPAAPSPQDLSMAFRYVAEHSLPAIVAIDTVGSSDGESPRSPHDEDFFRRFFEENPGLAPESPEDFDNFPPQEGTGSGFIIDPSGIIMTNGHVVEGAEDIVVRLYDGREFEAVSWAYDLRADVAIVRIEADGPLPVIALGDSSEMFIGDWVLAMGNPFDVGTTVTAGIISATGRGPGINEREDYLQTDAAINPGNSGGPLVSLTGEVIGVNTAISTQSGGYDGVGFSIPINMARWAAEQLIEHGHVRRSYLGVGLQELDGSLREDFGVPLGQGALVGQVFPNTPADAANLLPGDVVVRVDDVVVNSRGHLQEIVERVEPGTTVTCGVIRDGNAIAVEVTLEEMPSDFTPALQRGQRPGTESEPEPEPEPEVERIYEEYGFEISDIDADISEQFTLPDDVEGVVVTSVDASSPAGEAGLQPGDVISRVGQTEISSVDEFTEAVSGSRAGRGLLLHVQSGENSRFMTLKPLPAE